MVLGEEELQEGLQSQSPQVSEPSHHPETLFILESIVQRLKPRDAHHVRDMITERGRISGALFISSLLFWWIAISKGSDRMNDSEIPSSLLGSFDFHTVSLAVPILIVSFTLFTVVGREKGNATLSQIGGGLAVLALFYIIEPVLFNYSDINGGNALFASGRLLILAVMVGFASRFMFDAMLLQWVRANMLNMGIEVFPSSNEPSYEGQADESPPYA